MVGFPIHWRGDRRFHAERAGHAGDGIVDFGAIDQHFLGRRFVVGDALERDVRHDAADFLARLFCLRL